MKKIIFTITLSSFVLLMSCGGDSAEDMTVDCSESGLSVSEVGTSAASCSSDGSLEVSSSGGLGTITYSIDGATFQATGMFNVAAGSYTVTAKDENDCTTTTSVTVAAMGNTVLLNNPVSTDSGCETSNATITASASGGTGDLMYSLDGGTPQSSGVFEGVPAGSHTIEVSDDDDCTVSKNHQVLTGVSLASDIMPLLQAQCTFSGCHNGDNGSDRNWTEKEDILAKATTIRARTQSGSMPRSPGVLSQDQIDMIACWVDDGALDN